MKKIWVHKTDSFKDAEKFDRDYYLNMSPRERLEIIQYLREICFKIKGIKYADRKRFRRVIKVIQ